MKRITASNLVSEIDKLPRNRAYDYPNRRTKTKIEILSVELPEGPIIIKRYDASKTGPSGGKRESISRGMIWRIANAISIGKPINFDRALGASYSTRSAFEALLLHTPQFYNCSPGRIEETNSTSQVKPGHKHVLWLPEEPHEIGAIHTRKTDLVVSEIFTGDTFYDALDIPAPSHDMDIGIARRHAQIQIALLLIGQHLGFRTWIAREDRAIVYNKQKIAEMAGVIAHLEDEKLLSSYERAIKAAVSIDCIWFRNSRFIPAVIEIEHTTGVTSGLNRMKNFYNNMPNLKDIRWVIAGPDESRADVVKKASQHDFKELKIQFLPYSAIEELFSLCQRRNIRGVEDQFLDCFMEPCLSEA